MKRFFLFLLLLSSFNFIPAHAFELKEIKRVEGEEFYKRKSYKLSSESLPRYNEKKLKRVFNSIMKDMVECPAGSFFMGSPKNELSHRQNEKQHKVIISKPFYIGKYEVTQPFYELITGNNPSEFFDDNESDDKIYPVDCISWNEANQFCEILNSLFKEYLPRGYKFDLPTEAQWEYACRAGSTTSLNNNKDITSERDSCLNLDEVGWYRGNSYYSTHPVGQKLPNAWGIYDMHGNVSEWCKDSFNHSGNSIDSKNKSSSNENKIKIYRGGCWDNFPYMCRSASRIGTNTYVWSNAHGFRIAIVTDISFNEDVNQKKQNIINKEE